MKKLDISNVIVSTALSYLGKKELKGNSGFVDKEFEEEMIAAGWQTGWAWCAIFSKLVWCKAYGNFDSTLLESLNKIFNASAVKTFNNFKESSAFKIDQKPKPGALAFFQTYRNGKPHWTGHVCIVKEVHSDYFISIDGNSNGSGGREGIEVAKILRKYSFKNKNGLRLLGFVNPFIF